MRNAAKLWRWIWVLNAGLLIVFANPLYADSDDSLKAQNVELKKELAEFQTELRAMHQRMEALEARVNSGAAKGASAESAAPTNPAASAQSGPPPGDARGPVMLRFRVDHGLRSRPVQRNIFKQLGALTRAQAPVVR